MTANDPLASALSKVDNAVKALNAEVSLKRSNLLVGILDLLKENSYVGSYEEIEDGKQGMLQVQLLGTINKCGVVKPRYPVQVEELETYEQRFLPAKDFGVLILSTNKGLLTQQQAKDMNVGGTLIAYCY